MRISHRIFSGNNDKFIFAYIENKTIKYINLQKIKFKMSYTQYNNDLEYSGGHTASSPINQQSNHQQQQKQRSKTTILYLGYNEEHTCFTVGTSRGFYVYNANPLRERLHREMDGGIGKVEIMGRTNIVVLVGGGIQPAYSPNKVVVWDDRQGKSLADLEFSSEILGIQCRGDQLMVIQSHRVTLYDFESLSLVSQYETSVNRSGLAALNSNQECSVLAIPGNKQGDLRIELLNWRRSHLIKAHESKLSQICLTKDGHLVATSSEKGTLIRIWDTNSGTQLRELRRGLETANIQSLVLHPTGESLVLSSNKGTVHVYSLTGKADGQETNQKSTFSFMKGLLPKYFASEWSMLSFDGLVHQTTLACFASMEPNVIVLIGNHGHYAKYRYDHQRAHLEESSCFQF